MPQTIAVLDFGSQYTQVIARRIRECQVFSKIYHFSTPAEVLKADGVIGIILVRRPKLRLFEEGADSGCGDLRDRRPRPGDLLRHPADGAPSGRQGRPRRAARIRPRHPGDPPRGPAVLGPAEEAPGLEFARRPADEAPPGFTPIGRTENSPHAAIEDLRRNFYGIQFHPEVFHTERGIDVIRNFLSGVCHARQDWTTRDFIEHAVEARDLAPRWAASRVILGLSGGVDSSVAAALIHRAIGRQLTCVFVDNGLLRKGERKAVESLYKRNFKIDLRVVDALDLSSCAGCAASTSPERKRKIIHGNTFVEVFEKSLKKIGHADFLAQGTLYPDVIESVAIGDNPAALIKSHHNVGGLPARMRLKLLEPLRELFKDEVRRVGSALGLPREVVWRQPFPGPGLGVRVVGPISPANLDILRESDAILQEEMMASGWYWKVWQSFCVFLPVKTVGVIGDERNYAFVIALRIVESTDAMTADWTRLPYDLLQKISGRINTNEVREISRVVLDISSKPPATIEWGVNFLRPCRGIGCQ